MSAPVIAGRYNLLRRIGHGGMAEVFLARLEGIKGFQKLVVVKRILPHLAQDGEFVTMFLDEARTAADLRHPNVINIMDIGRDQGTYFMAMEFVHGQDVRRLQRKVSKRKTHFPFAHAIEITMGAAAGLHYAHTKHGLNGAPMDIVHRDVSPQNILVSYTGETKVVDFGIAKAATQSEQTAVGVIKGKYAYMSPEQARGDPLTASSDLFALGVVFWEILTLRRLFKRKNESQTLQAVIDCKVPDPRRFREDCPPALAEACMRALGKRPDQRYRSCEEFRQHLEDIAAELGLSCSPARLGRWVSDLYADELEDEAALSKEQLEDDGHSLNSLPAAAHTRKLAATAAARRSTNSASAKVSRKSRQTPVVSAPTDKTTRTKRPKAAPATRTQVVSPLSQHLARNRGIYIAAAAVTAVVLTGVAVVVWLLSQPGDLAVILRSEPSGANVFVDGVATGTRTPHILRGKEGETFTVRVTVGDHATQKRVRIGDVPEVTLVIESP